MYFNNFQINWELKIQIIYINITYKIKDLYSRGIYLINIPYHAYRNREHENRI